MNDAPSLETIVQRIFVMRGRKVLLDADLASLYGVETRRLNEQVRRNLKQFPDDFISSCSEKPRPSGRGVKGADCVAVVCSV